MPHTARPCIPFTRFCLLAVAGVFQLMPLSATATHDPSVAPLAFAAREIDLAQQQSGRENLAVSLRINSAMSKPESFQIRSVGENQVQPPTSSSTPPHCATLATR